MQQNNNRKRYRISLRTILNGRILESDWLRRNRLLIFLVVVMLLVNISIRYKSEKTIRHITALQDSLKELRSESVAVAAELMKMSRPSEVMDRIEKSNLGLEVSKEPPRRLYVDKE